MKKEKAEELNQNILHSCPFSHVAPSMKNVRFRSIHTTPNSPLDLSQEAARTEHAGSLQDARSLAALFPHHVYSVLGS